MEKPYNSDPHYSHGAQSNAAILGHPVHPLLVPIAIGMYVGAVCADIGFARTGDVFWARGASWLLLGTLIAAGIASLSGMVDLVSIQRARRLSIAWVHGMGNTAFWFLTLWNYWRRLPDPTAQHTENLVISLFGLALMGIAGWLGGEMSFRHGIGVSEKIGVSEDRLR